jgi:WD40 repeat protein
VHVVTTDRVGVLPPPVAGKPAYGVSFSPDGKRLLVGYLLNAEWRGGDDNVVAMYDAVTLARLSAWSVGKGEGEPVVAWPASGGSAGLHLWEPIASARDAGMLRAVAVSPDGTLVASASDKIARVWAAPTLAPRSVLAHPDRVDAVAFAGSASVITAAADGQVRAFSIDGGEPRWTAEVGDIHYGLAVSGQDVVATGHAGFVRIDLATGRVVVRERMAHGMAISALDGGGFARADADGVVRILTRDAKELARILPVRGRAGAWVIAGGGYERIGDAGSGLLCRDSGRVVEFERCAGLERRELLAKALGR